MATDISSAIPSSHATLDTVVDSSSRRTPSAMNLQRLVVLRTIILGGQAMAAWTAVGWWEIALPLTSISAVFIVALLVNLLTWVRLRRSPSISDVELFAHLVFDVMALTAVLYFAGGSTNPFAPLYLVPLTLTAAALPARYTAAMTFLTIVCYSALLFVYVPLPHQGLHDFHLHVLGMWLGFLMGAALIAYFVVRMRETVQERDRLLARMREQELRHEKLLALGTLAAGAAHELGTPLSTMAVLANDLTRDSEGLPDKLRLIRDEIDRCKEILASLSAAAGQTRAEGGGVQSLDTYLQQLIDGWGTRRSGLRVDVNFLGSLSAPRIVADQTLTQALTNVLNNAADVSSDIVVDVVWSETDLDFHVRDHGPGLSDTAQRRVGEPFFTTKAPGEGMGLGLFLARGTIERMGGSLVLDNHPDGGAVCRVRIPFGQLRVLDV